MTLTVEPRVVDVRTVSEFLDREGSPKVIVSSTLVPAVPQTCREARCQGLYQKHFSEVAAALLTTEAQEAGQSLPLPKQLPYFWLNLDMDVVSIGASPLRHFLPIAPRIKRLRLAPSKGASGFYFSQGRHLNAAFVNLEEIQIVCVGQQRWGWEQAKVWHSWPCGLGNLYFIDATDNRMMESAEMDVVMDESRKEYFRQIWVNDLRAAQPDESDAALDAILARAGEEEEPERSAGIYEYESP
ncbi:hypothetical protein PG993_014877 [Apiospora rasikravindrae]|uniref:Uncharacterized protein n=1 Tax=Apiospora rasikravindrae TaxID=990691 RepID=A0ABR1RP39_9PEZI